MKKRFCVLQKKVLSFGPNPTVKVRPNSSTEPNARSITTDHATLCFVMGSVDKSNLKEFVIREDNGGNNSLFLSFQMGLSDGVFFMIKHTPLPNGNHPISSPICPMGVADTFEHYINLKKSRQLEKP